MAQRLKSLPVMWVRSLGWEDPWRRKWQPSPVLLPGESHGRRNLMGYSPWGLTESDTTEWLHLLTYLLTSAAAAKSLQWLFLLQCMKVKSEVKVTQSCPTLCGIVHGILQARILEWVAFPFSRGSSQLWDRTQVSCVTGGFFTSWATREAQKE